MTTADLKPKDFDALDFLRDQYFTAPRAMLSPLHNADGLRFHAWCERVRVACVEPDQVSLTLWALFRVYWSEGQRPERMAAWAGMTPRTRWQKFRVWLRELG